LLNDLSSVTQLSSHTVNLSFIDMMCVSHGSAIPLVKSSTNCYFA